jgi:hypothetical protein
MSPFRHVHDGKRLPARILRVRRHSHTRRLGLIASRAVRRPSCTPTRILDPAFVAILHAFGSTAPDSRLEFIEIRASAAYLGSGIRVAKTSCMADGQNAKRLEVPGWRRAIRESDQ